MLQAENYNGGSEMSKITDKILDHMALAAERAFRETMGFASRGGAYEPRIPSNRYVQKTHRTSKLEAIYDTCSGRTKNRF